MEGLCLVRKIKIVLINKDYLFGQGEYVLIVTNLELTCLAPGSSLVSIKHDICENWFLRIFHKALGKKVEISRSDTTLTFRFSQD